MNYKLYYFEWNDAITFHQAWADSEEAIEWLNGKEGLVKHVGWLIAENNEYVLLASRLGNINQDEIDLGSLFKIPSNCIIRKIELKIK